MNRNNLTLVKGVSNKIEITIKNANRKNANFSDKEIWICFSFLENSSLFLKKRVFSVDDQKGLFELDILPGELDNLPPGFYHYSLYSKDLSGKEMLLYTDSAFSTTGSAEILDGIVNALHQTIEVTEFSQIQGDCRLFSSRYAGDSQLNCPDGIQSFAVYCQNFTGRFWIQGSIDNDPSVYDYDWFDIALTDTNSYYFFQNFSGVKSFNVPDPALWFRMVYHIDHSNTGMISKILYRP